jgi:squalene-hopene/tetraprenyl-beta-curcumene cyclase
MTQDWILRGRDWLESCQNDDGGWGETCATYENAAMKGIGASTASQTAWAIMGICACGDLGRQSIQRGLRFLLSSQTSDGSWEEPQITGTGFPGVFYLKYDMYRQNFPLLALATYVNYRKGFITKPGFYQAK